MGFVLQSAFVFLPHHPLHGGLFDPDELFSNTFLVQNYRPQTLLTGIVPAWSLGVEVVFYLTLPLLVLVAFALARRLPSRRLAALAPALILLAIGASGKAVATFAVTSHGPFAGYQHDWNSVIEKSFWCHADLFAFGMALAVIHVEVDRGTIRPPRFWRAIAAATAVGAYAATARWTDDIGERLGRSPFNTLMALACARARQVWSLSGQAMAISSGSPGSCVSWKLGLSSPSASSRTACSSGTSRSSIGSTTTTWHGLGRLVSFRILR